MKNLPKILKLPISNFQFPIFILPFIFFLFLSMYVVQAQEEVEIPGPELKEASFTPVDDLQIGDWVFVKGDEEKLIPERII